MKRTPVVGECLVVTRADTEGPSSVEHRERIVVSKVDSSDSTLKGLRNSGAGKAVTGWIPWADVEPVRLGWNYASEHIPAELVALLAATDGCETLSLNMEVKLAILAQLPDLRDRILSVTQDLPEE